MTASIEQTTFRMKPVWFFFCLILILQAHKILMYRQTDYVLILERVEMGNYDKHYINLARIKTFKFNRTATAINFTFDVNIGFGTELKAQIQLYKFASNEYREFPMRLMFDVCDSITKTDDWGLLNLYDCGNCTKCPMKKGIFTICNWSPNFSKFPPYIPGGRYKADITIIYRSKEIGLLQVYTEVKPKNPWDYHV